MSSWHGRIVSKLSSRTLVQKSYGHRHFSLRTIPNVVRTQDGAHIPDAVLPFNFDFVDDRLRKALVRRKINVDEVERLYNSQVRNDYEFNSPALPQQDSPLWGYVYGEHLVRSKVRLETLSKEEEFLRKYLQCTVDELTTRMKRYYPQLDWQSRFEYEIAQVKLPINEELEDCYADATAEVISRSPSAYISFHKNNAFIQKYDDNDEFKDHVN
ncbi:hypothetical protein RFI_31069 [Reticulomyxa filosa]|uniref:Uncharacterized protein n=1 Tax=Reticulomyxa filosa TaxID=46433 RepID=X6M008_RETFI|nr:hypothetical protein RFI_31069 [Reticulomyxa filosa]|eukprot:ETO06325.1 hypothetical protein RFI_31069 [Reticulomyxa filosa]